MQWDHLSVDAEIGFKEGMPCCICGKTIFDLIFSPKDPWSTEARPIISAWQGSFDNSANKDPTLFYSCRECMEKIDPQYIS